MSTATDPLGNYSLRLLMQCAQYAFQKSVATIQTIADQFGMSKMHFDQNCPDAGRRWPFAVHPARGGGKARDRYLVGQVFRGREKKLCLLHARHLRAGLVEALVVLFTKPDGITLSNLMNTTQAQLAVLQPLTFQPGANKFGVTPAA